MALPSKIFCNNLLNKHDEKRMNKSNFFETPSDARENDSVAKRNTNATALRIIFNSPSYIYIEHFKHAI
jgi:hypothetical protein